MAKIIGYLIGGAFVLAFLMPIPISLWLSYERSGIYFSSNVEDASISRCYSYRSSGSNSKLSFGPVAETDSGTEVEGGFRWSKRSWCESDVGDEVSVLIHSSDASKNMIFSFFQFWFLPIIFLAISFILYPILYIKKKRSK